MFLVIFGKDASVITTSFNSNTSSAAFAAALKTQLQNNSQLSDKITISFGYDQNFIEVHADTLTAVEVKQVLVNLLQEIQAAYADNAQQILPKILRQTPPSTNTAPSMDTSEERKSKRNKHENINLPPNVNDNNDAFPVTETSRNKVTFMKDPNNPNRIIHQVQNKQAARSRRNYMDKKISSHKFIESPFFEYYELYLLGIIKIYYDDNQLIIEKEEGSKPFAGDKTLLEMTEAIISPVLVKSTTSKNPKNKQKNNKGTIEFIADPNNPNKFVNIVKDVDTFNRFHVIRLKFDKFCKANPLDEFAKLYKAGQITISYEYNKVIVALDPNGKLNGKSFLDRINQIFKPRRGRKSKEFADSQSDAMVEKKSSAQPEEEVGQPGIEPLSSSSFSLPAEESCDNMIAGEASLMNQNDVESSQSLPTIDLQLSPRATGDDIHLLPSLLDLTDSQNLLIEDCFAASSELSAVTSDHNKRSNLQQLSNENDNSQNDAPLTSSPKKSKVTFFPDPTNPNRVISQLSNPAQAQGRCYYIRKKLNALKLLERPFSDYYLLYKAKIIKVFWEGDQVIIEKRDGIGSINVDKSLLEIANSIISPNSFKKVNNTEAEISQEMPMNLDALSEQAQPQSLQTQSSSTENDSISSTVPFTNIQNLSVDELCKILNVSTNEIPIFNSTEATVQVSAEAAAELSKMLASPAKDESSLPAENTSEVNEPPTGDDIANDDSAFAEHTIPADFSVEELLNLFNISSGNSSEVNRVGSNLTASNDSQSDDKTGDDQQATQQTFLRASHLGSANAPSFPSALRQQSIFPPEDNDSNNPSSSRKEATPKLG